MSRTSLTHPWTIGLLRWQTAALLAVWVTLLFMEWGKPGVVGNRFNPQWVLLALAISATLTAFLAPREGPPESSAGRRTIALAVGLVAWVSVGIAVSSPVGWLVGVAVWGGVIAALGPQRYGR